MMKNLKFLALACYAFALGIFTARGRKLMREGRLAEAVPALQAMYPND